MEPPPSPPPPKLPSFLMLGPALWGPEPDDNPPGPTPDDNPPGPTPDDNPPDPPPPQVYIGSGRYTDPHTHEEGEVVYEFRLIGIGGAGQEFMDSTIDFPDSAQMVIWGSHRWEGWVQAFGSGDDSFLPALLPDQRRPLLVIARFLRVLCRCGPGGIPIEEWPLFWDIFMDGFPPCQYLMRGEAHLLRVASWLRNRYPGILGRD